MTFRPSSGGGTPLRWTSMPWEACCANSLAAARRFPARLEQPLPTVSRPRTSPRGLSRHMLRQATSPQFSRARARRPSSLPRLRSSGTSPLATFQGNQASAGARRRADRGCHHGMPCLRPETAPRTDRHARRARRARVSLRRERASRLERRFSHPLHDRHLVACRGIPAFRTACAAPRGTDRRHACMDRDLLDDGIACRRGRPYAGCARRGPAHDSRASRPPRAVARHLYWIRFRSRKCGASLLVRRKCARASAPVRLGDRLSGTLAAELLCASAMWLPLVTDYVCACVPGVIRERRRASPEGTGLAPR